MYIYHSLHVYIYVYTVYTHTYIMNVCFSVLIIDFRLECQSSLKNQVTQGLRTENSLITAHPLAVRCRFIGMILKFL